MASPFTDEEHRRFMARAIELGAKGGLVEKVGGKSCFFLVSSAICTLITRGLMLHSRQLLF